MQQQLPRRHPPSMGSSSAPNLPRIQAPTSSMITTFAMMMAAMIFSARMLQAMWKAALRKGLLGTLLTPCAQAGRGTVQASERVCECWGVGGREGGTCTLFGTGEMPTCRI